MADDCSLYVLVPDSKKKLTVSQSCTSVQLFSFFNCSVVQRFYEKIDSLTHIFCLLLLCVKVSIKTTIPGTDVR